MSSKSRLTCITRGNVVVVQGNFTHKTTRYILLLKVPN